MSEGDVFEVGEQFVAGEVSGNVQLGKFESFYEQLFAEVIEDGIITPEERSRLDKAADTLGLDRQRLHRLEQALQAAYEARHKIQIREIVDYEEAPRPSLQPLEPATDQRTLALERRIQFLESRVVDLERELEEARAQAAVEIDLSDFAAADAGKAVPDDDPVELLRRVRHDPRDADTLHALFRIFTKANDIDRRWCIAHALMFLGEANSDEKTCYQQNKIDGLVRPSTALSREGWRRLLFHPEQEVLVGDILAAVAPAVLLGRVSALRRDKALPKLDPARRQDPAKSTLQAVRCFSWAASLLGMSAPPLYADPEFAKTVDMVPGLPPQSRLGKQALSGRSATELAFLAGRHLGYYREEQFLRLLLPSIQDIEDIFLAALSIGNPGLPMNPQVKARVVPIASAIEPILDPSVIDRLRGHFLRFVEEGGRANLQRFAVSADKTSNRTGLLLSNDLRSAANMLAIEDPAHVDEQIDDLLEFVVSDRYAKLRKQLGIALLAN